MLKICLQVCVCGTLTWRVWMLVGHLRRIWRSDGRRDLSLAAQFHQELRRRGLLPSLPTIESSS